MIGYSYIHSTVDGHSRLAYSEVLPDERRHTAIALWQRANAFFAGHGITHKKIRPYRPQTNSKVERFNRTLLDEWAYLRPYASNNERTEALADFLHTENHHRCRTAINGHPPISRVSSLRTDTPRAWSAAYGSGESPSSCPSCFSCGLLSPGQPAEDRGAGTARAAYSWRMEARGSGRALRPVREPGWGGGGRAVLSAVTGLRSTGRIRFCGGRRPAASPVTGGAMGTAPPRTSPRRHHTRRAASLTLQRRMGDLVPLTC